MPRAAAGAQPAPRAASALLFSALFGSPTLISADKRPLEYNDVFDADKLQAFAAEHCRYVPAPPSKPCPGDGITRVVWLRSTLPKADDASRSADTTSDKAEL